MKTCASLDTEIWGNGPLSWVLTFWTSIEMMQRAAAVDSVFLGAFRAISIWRSTIGLRMSSGIGQRSRTARAINRVSA
jgi:hypothetical protein